MSHEDFCSSDVYGILEYVSENWAIVASYNDLLPVRCQAIISTQDGLLLGELLGTNLNGICIKIQFCDKKVWTFRLQIGGHFVSGVHGNSAKIQMLSFNKISWNCCLPIHPHLDPGRWSTKNEVFCVISMYIVSQAGISNYIPEFTVGCNDLFLPEVHVSSTQVFK